ncbi:aspartic proteinase [Gloeophyllum trabeum ATCC 11539]|uniref:Aspartic proteinase n=1 Tax=Gloeophyllum trabeum (strain ATCC 11539 / FP-39264 / Madison 617) TaxID=670483 RepID=S7QAB2_GLOTA|nr:aspartic proteinase [Gloeophyllum trabeum ATCC 11539]EPQ56856.1 aspartic proteinase [Gloeophyllum trabeum ATCC 11539]
MPIARRFKTNSNGVAKIVENDRARIAHLKNLSKDKAASSKRAEYSFSVTNGAVSYYATVGVGSPATDYTLIVDTGSSNTWVGAYQRYTRTSTSKSTGDRVEVSYGSGAFEGTEYTDRVTLSSNLVINSQSIGVASESEGFGDGVDGILGIGPTDLTEGTVSNVNEVPTVTDNLYSQGTISSDAVGVFFAPTTSESDTNGELTFGGADTTKYTGTLNYVPVTTTEPASYYWGVNQEVTYNGETILSETAGIVDTGTTLVYLATDAYDRYVSATGATLDSENTGLLEISAAQYAALQTLDFNIGGTTYGLTANGQIWPRSLNTYIGGSSGSIYLVVNDLGSDSGEGLDFINGYTFLERFYTVFDTTTSSIGFATTSYTDATTN